MSLNEGRECSLGDLRIEKLQGIIAILIYVCIKLRSLPAVDHGLIDQQRTSRRWW